MSIRSDRFTDSVNIINFHQSREIDFLVAMAAVESMPDVLEGLQEELSSNVLYRTIWHEAEGVFAKKQNIIKQKNAGKKKIMDECHIAIIAYTSNTKVRYLGKERKLYQHFNEECRRLTKEEFVDNFPYKSLYCLLLEAHRGVKSNPDWNQKLYRGVTTYYKPSTLREEDMICNFNQYTSFTPNKEVALGFIRNSGNKGTLIKIEAPMAAYGIANYSLFPKEMEVLVCPWSTFCVDTSKLDQKGSIHTIVLDNGDYPYIEHLPYARQW